MGDYAERKMGLKDVTSPEQLATVKAERVTDPANLVIHRDTVKGWLTDGEPEPRKSLLGTDKDPYLVRGKSALLVAPGGGGKTGLLAQLAVSVATGQPWLGHKVTEPGKVLLALGEEDEDEIRRRVFRAFQGLECDADEARKLIAENLTPLPLYATNPRLAEASPFPGEAEDETAFFGNLVAYLEGNGPWALIIIDPASRFMGAEAETDNAAATRFVELLERLTQTPGNPTVLVAHHTNKSALQGGATNQGAARGSSALVDGVRWNANIERIEEPDGLPEQYRDWRRLRVVKTNYTATPRPVTLRFERGKGWVPVTEAEELERERAMKKGGNAAPAKPSGYLENLKGGA